MNTLAARAAAESVKRVEHADERALLAAKAFAMGQWDKYFDYEVKEFERELDEHFAVGESEIDQR